MNTSSPPTPAGDDVPGPAQKAADTQYYRATLHDLIDMGTQLAHAVHAHAMRAIPAPPDPVDADAPPAPTPDLTPNLAPNLTIAFDRIARTVRRTILLARHIAEPPPAAHSGRTAARKQILRGCEDKIAIAAFGNRATPGRIDAGALRVELLERLDAPDLAEALDDDIETRPVAEIVAELCRDLGLGLTDIPGLCPALRRTPADIATLNARAARRRPAPGATPEPRTAARQSDRSSARRSTRAAPVGQACASADALA